MPLTAEQRRRYARQIGLPEIGPAGQQRLLGSRVLLAGVGGLGSAAGYYLAAAGVGTLGLADDDRVGLSNLQRQIVYRTADVGRLKVEAAAEAWMALNPDLRTRLHPLRLTAANAPGLAGGYDVVVDATDTLAAKAMLARASRKAQTPIVQAGVQGYQGQILTVLPGKTACWGCVFGRPAQPEPAAPAAGPLGAVPGVLGALQAAEVLKLLAGVGGLLTDRVLFFDVRRIEFRTVRAVRDPGCPICGRAARAAGKGPSLTTDARKTRRPCHEPNL